MSDAPPGDVADDAARRIAWAAPRDARALLDPRRFDRKRSFERLTYRDRAGSRAEDCEPGAGAAACRRAGERALPRSVDHRRGGAGARGGRAPRSTPKEQRPQERDAELARGFFQTRPDILLDDGAELIRLAHREHPDLVEDMLGAAEETTSGVQALRVMHEQGVLKIPVIAVSDSRIKHLFDNVYGTGQSCVMALLDITNLQLAGRLVMVVGYGWVGQGVARHAAALGARVIVSEIDAVKALQALHDGHRVQSLSDAAPDVEIVFAATGVAGAVTEPTSNACRTG